tara:strand:- start:84 stop:194 length:111 start_codon:yes stop_codon:yes gene_type:complete
MGKSAAMKRCEGYLATVKKGKKKSSAKKTKPKTKKK